MTALGCPGIDLDAWRAANRVPLFPAKVNWWIVARTLRDSPSDSDVRQTWQAVCLHWFGGWPHEAMEVKSETQAGPMDNIQIHAVSRTRPTLPQGISRARRREDLPYGPLPTVEGTPTYLLVSFAWRSQVTDAPWPTYKSPGAISLPGTAECPTNADWMLMEVGSPVKDAPPEQGWAEKAAGAAGEAVSEVLPSSSALKAGGLLLGLGFLTYLVSKFKRR